MSKSVSKKMSKPSTTDDMCDFKQYVLDFQAPIIWGNNASPVDSRVLGIRLLTKVIPQCDTDNEVAIMYDEGRDAFLTTNAEKYKKQCAQWRKMGHKKNDGDSTFYYDFKNKEGVMRRCLINTEIWYDEDDDDETLSATAILFAQFFGYGTHVIKVSFANKE